MAAVAGVHCECGFGSPKDLKECPRCGKSFVKDKEELKEETEPKETHKEDKKDSHAHSYGTLRKK